MSDEQQPAHEWEAGRQLDAEIARRVFGIKRLYGSEGKPWQADDPWPLYIPSGKPWRTHHLDSRPLPRFSSDMDAAMLIFDRLVDLGLHVLLARDPGDPYEVEVCVTEELYKRGLRGCIVMANTAQMAICRAALRAKQGGRGGVMSDEPTADGGEER